jgi:hypothetical protein
VGFSVAPGTPAGPVAVSIDSFGGNTLILDVNANPIDFSPANGTITVIASAVPEPNGAILALMAVGELGVPVLHRYRRAG